MKQFKLIVKSICSVLLLWAFSTGPAVAQTITEIIDATGDGIGNPLDRPWGIAVDGSGNVYVPGTRSWNAFKITPGGVITEIIDATGDGTGNTLNRPYHIAVDGSGNVDVSGVWSDNVFKITPGGVITEIIDAAGDGAGNTLSWPESITVDGSGNVYVTGQNSNNAFKITSGGVITKIIDATGDGSGNTLVGPVGIAVDASDNVYVTGHLNKVFKITPGGFITVIIDARAGKPLTGPNSIAVDGSGNVYVSAYISENAFKITPGGVITEIIDATGDGIGNPLKNPRAIAVDGSGNVYVAGVFSNNAFKITPGGVITEIIDATGDGIGNPLDEPFGIAVDGSGNVYVPGNLSHNAFKITPGGVITKIIDATGDGAGNLLNNPIDIDVDGSGNVYVTGHHSDNAFKITPGGVITEIIDATGDGAGNPLDGSWEIAVDASGNVYVTGRLSDNAFKIVPADGTISGTVSVDGNGLESVLVKLLDEFVLPVDGFDDQQTDANGEYSFIDVPAGDYQVMIVEPLGYISDGSTKTTTVVTNETSVVNFNLTEVVVVNQARSKGYWKHQFDVYVKGRGNAQESAADLQSYIDEIILRYNQHFNIFVDATDGSDDFEDWQDILSVKGNAGMEAKATAQLAALVLNIMSLKIAQYEVVTTDGKTAGDVLTYVSELIEDPYSSNDELAKDLAESVNNQQMIAAGKVPGGDILFKVSSEIGEVLTYDLENNYPNPFNPSTVIKYQIPDAGFVTLKVYDVLGNELATLVTENKEPGKYNITFDASALSSGVYIYKLAVNDFIDTKKMILMK